MTTALPSAKTGNEKDLLLARIHELEKGRRSTGIQPTDRKSQQTIQGVLWHPSRMPKNPVVVSMDREFIGHRRQLAWNTARDIEQNMARIGWMIRVHIAYTADFEFQPRTPDVEYNRELREWFFHRTTKERIDVQRRFSFQEMMGTWAALQVLDGYSLILKSQKGRFQLVEAWNIARGGGVETDEGTYGVNVNKDGVVLDDYNAIDWAAICSGQTSGTLKHEYLAYRDEFILDGHTIRAADTLWESPMLPVLDKCRDLMDADEYNLMKAKLHAMFVVARFMKPETKGGADFPMREGIGGFPFAEDVESVDQSPAPIPAPPPMSELRSGTLLNMEADEKVEFLESKTPSNEYVVYVKNVGRDIQSILDQPYSFWDSETANYSSMKADSVRYSIACRPKRRKNAAAWRQGISHILRAGTTEDMPMWRGKYTADNLPYGLIPTAAYILDPSKELPAMIAKLNACLTDHESACDELGSGDFYDIVDRKANQLQYAAKKGVPINLGNVSIKLTGDAGEEQDKSKKTEPVVVEDDTE